MSLVTDRNVLALSESLKRLEAQVSGQARTISGLQASVGNLTQQLADATQKANLAVALARGRGATS